MVNLIQPATAGERVIMLPSVCARPPPTVHNNSSAAGQQRTSGALRLGTGNYRFQGAAGSQAGERHRT